MAAISSYINALYIVMYNRTADSNGYNYWSSPAQTGALLPAAPVTDALSVSMASSFKTAQSAYFDAQYAALSDTNYILKLYQNLGGSTAGVGGDALIYWQFQLDKYSGDRAKLAGEFTKTFLDYAGTDAAGLARKAVFDNKVSVSLAWVDASKTNAFMNAVTTTDAAYAAQTRAIDGVTGTGASLNLALAQVTQVVATSNLAAVTGVSAVGETFVLTTASDNMTGAGGNDVFNATQLTFNGSDTLVGGLGNDTLIISDTGTAAWTAPAALVSGIENITVRNANGTAAVAAVTGVTAVNETQTVTITGTATAAAVVSFLGINTAALAANDTATTIATAIVTAKAAIIAGSAAQAAGLTDITNAAGVLTLTFGGTNGKGNVANIAASAVSNGATFTAGVEVVRGVAGVAAVDAVAAATFTDTIAADKFVGATTFNVDNSTGQVDFTALVATNTVNVLGNTATVNGATSATWGTSEKSAVLNLVGGTTAGAVTVVAAGASTVTIGSSGVPLTSTGTTGTNTVTSFALGGLSTSKLIINADSNITAGSSGTFTTAAKDIVVSGAATSVNLGSKTDGKTDIIATNLETIDASGLTKGGVLVGLTAGVKSFVGGQGNDTVATAAFSNTGVTINAGGGTGDLLIIDTAGDLDTTAEAAVYTNFDTVRAASGSFDASLMAGATGFQLMGAGTLSNLNAAQANNVQIRVAGAYVAALANSTGTSDVLSLSLGTATKAEAALSITTGLTANGFETINLKTNAGSTSAVGADKTSTIAAFTADSVTAINLTGNAFVLSNIATAKAVTINGSALTGDGSATPAGLTVAGSAFADSTVTGSAFVDTFTLGTVGSTYNSGAGADSISSSVANLLAGGVYNTVNAGDGIDTLTVTTAANTAVTMVDNTFRNLSNIEKITVGTSGTAATSITTGGWFDKAFAAAGAEITATTTTGVLTIDASTFTGAMKVTATTVGTGAGEGTVTVTTGSGNDTVIVSNATAGNDGVIVTGAGNDTITGGGDADSITAGTGVDTITGGAGADIFIFAAGASGLPTDSNFDTITDFANTSDIINLVAYTIVTNTSTTAGTASITAAGIATFQAADVTLAQRLVATESGINAGGAATAGQTALFQFGADAYLFVSDGIDGIGANDRFVKLVGIDTTAAASDTLTASGAGVSFTIA